MTVSVNEAKVFDEIQHTFMINTFVKVGIQGTYLNIIKAIYDKHRTNIILKMKS